MTYMASCGSTSCAQFNGSSANWFKIDELGQMSNGSWYQLDISEHSFMSPHVSMLIDPK